MKSKTLQFSPLASLQRAFTENHIEPDVVRSLRLMLVSNIMGTLCGIVCSTGSNTMIGLANELHANDLSFGILNSIPQIAVLLQIPAAMLVNYTHKRKKYLMSYGVISRVLWILIGLIPFFVPMSNGQLGMWIILFLLGISSILGSFINVCWFPWLGDLTPLSIRGIWLSTRDAINSVISVIGGLIVAWLLDHLDGQSKYAILFGIGGLAGVLDIALYGLCKEVYVSPPEKPSLKALSSDIITNKKFFHFMVFWTIHSFACNFGGAYINRYAINDMKISFMMVTICSSITCSLMTILFVGRWGKRVVRFGSKPVMWVTGIIGGGAQFLLMLFTPGHSWSLLVYNLVGGIFWCGANLVCSQVQLSYSTESNRAGSIAVFSAVTSLLGGFLGVLTGGYALDFLEKINYTGFIDRYKLIILIAGVIRVLAAVVFVPGMENEKNATVGMMLADIKEEWRSVFMRVKSIRAKK